MSIKLNTDIGVQGDNIADILNDEGAPKSIKTLVKEILEEIERPDFKSYLLSRNTYSFPYSLFMLTRSIVDTAKIRFNVPAKLQKISESTKLISIATLPFAVLGLTDRIKFITSDESKSTSKKVDGVFDTLSEVANVCEGTGFIMEGSVVILEEARILLPFASVLGIASTLVGLVNIAIDTKGIFKTTHKAGKIPSRYKDLKLALIERFSYKNISHALNILSTSVTFVAFSLVFFGPQTFLLAGAIVMTGGLAIGLGRTVLDIYADQLLKEKIYAIKAAAAA